MQVLYKNEYCNIILNLKKIYVCINVLYAPLYPQANAFNESVVDRIILICELNNNNRF